MRELKRVAGQRWAVANATSPELRPQAGIGSSSSSRLDREVWIVSAVVVCGVIMSILDTTIVNVALETLSRELSAPLGTIQWVSIGYMLALASVIPLTGWSSERFGTRRVWMLSVAMFGAGSVLCGLAWSVESLIAFRVLQGVGGGMIMPVGMSVLAQTAGPHRVARVMSIVGVPMMLAPILGPVIGGLIVSQMSWRWIFYVNVPIAVLSLGLAARLLHAGHGRADAGRLDWFGLALLSPGITGVLVGLSEAESHGGVSYLSAWGPIIAGAFLIAAFVWHAAHAARPLLDVRLFRVPAFSAAAATTFLLAATLFGGLIVLPLYYQIARGESALTTGVLMAPQGAGTAVAMLFAGRLADRVGGGHVALVGLVIVTAGTLPLAILSSYSSYALLSGFLVVRGIGIGATMMPAMAAAYATLQRADVPRATSALNVLQRIGGSLGTAVLAVVLQHEIRAAAGRGQGAVAVRLSEEARRRVADPLATAFAHTFWWAVAAPVLALVPAVILAFIERRGAQTQPAGPEMGDVPPAAARTGA